MNVLTHATALKPAGICSVEVVAIVVLGAGAIAPPASPDALPLGIVCENVESGVLQPATPVLQNGQFVCTATTQSVDL